LKIIRDVVLNFFPNFFQGESDRYFYIYIFLLVNVKQIDSRKGRKEKRKEEGEGRESEGREGGRKEGRKTQKC